MKTSEKARLAWAQASHISDQDRFAEYYLLYHGAVRAVLFRFGITVDLDDLVQEVFLKAYRCRADFRQESSIKTWILSISINVAKDHIKRRRFPFSETPLESLEAPSHDPDLLPAIHRALRSLDLIYRELIILCSLEGYSMEESSEILNIPEGTVKSRLATARERMRLALAKEGIKI